MLDQIGFVGNFSTSGQGEISVLDVLEMSGSRDAEKMTTSRTAARTPGTRPFPPVRSGPSGGGFRAVCIRSRKRRK